MSPEAFTAELRDLLNRRCTLVESVEQITPTEVGVELVDGGQLIITVETA